MRNLYAEEKLILQKNSEVERKVRRAWMFEKDEQKSPRRVLAVFWVRREHKPLVEEFITHLRQGERVT